MPHWYSEHQGRRSLGSAPQQSRSPSVTLPAPASARDDDSGRQHTVISKEAKMTNAAPHTSFRPQRSGVEKSHSSNNRNVTPPSSFRPQRSGVEKSHAPMVQRAWSQETLPPLPAPASAGDNPWADRFPEKVIKKAVRNGYAFLHSLFSIEKSSPRGRAFSVLQASAAFAFLVRKY